MHFLTFIKKLADRVYISPNWKTKNVSESVWQMDQESNLAKSKTWSWAQVSHATVQWISPKRSQIRCLVPFLRTMSLTKRFSSYNGLPYVPWYLETLVWKSKGEGRTRHQAGFFKRCPDMWDHTITIYLILLLKIWRGEHQAVVVRVPSYLIPYHT